MFFREWEFDSPPGHKINEKTQCVFDYNFIARGKNRKADRAPSMRGSRELGEEVLNERSEFRLKQLGTVLTNPNLPMGTKTRIVLLLI